MKEDESPPQRLLNSECNARNAFSTVCFVFGLLKCAWRNEFDIQKGSKRVEEVVNARSNNKHTQNEKASELLSSLGEGGGCDNG